MTLSSFQKSSGGVVQRETGAEPPLLALSNLRIAIRGKTILDGISLSIRAGGITALTGESGSGKSMTALAVIGLLPEGAEVSGTIHMAGRDLTALSETQMNDLRGREIGMVFQEPMTALNPVQTIGAQVAETLLLHTGTSRTEAEARAGEVLARVGLPPDQIPLSRYPHELSGGQRQRVVIAMAIALRPRLLIADEPTTALDVTTQAQILALLRRLAREDGMALMMITHDLAVVADMADHIAVMNAGEIVEQGPTEQVLREMHHPYTRALFEASNHRATLLPMSDGKPLLQVADLVRDYPRPRAGIFAKRAYTRAVDGVSLEIRSGERVGLVGESGCGKSTLTRAILGLEPVQGGTITLDGAPILSGKRADPALRRRLSVVFQDPYGSFNPRHRVARLISEPFHLFPDAPKGTAREEAVSEALTAVGLSPSDAGKYIHAFSGGQRQRIAIARALITKPELIVFDEAVSALDVRVRAQVLDLVAKLSHDYGLAYLFISHDLTVVRSITDRVLVMQAGRIVEAGPTAEVLHAPEHPYTKALVAAAPRLPDLRRK
jgi:peptide/nickel transport system ATP-binding protein